LSYKIAFKKSVSRDLKKLSKDNAERILDKIAQDLPAMSPIVITHVIAQQ
jgi:mRNA-degrading endonuclease RelE of RelBE toxin-antitoxin system